MQTQQPAASPRQLCENKYKVARANLLLMLVFTFVNIVLLFVDSEIMFLFSATIPYYAVIFGALSENGAFLLVTVIFAAVCLLGYLLCWIFSKKRYGWMIAALVFFAMDTLALVGLFLLAGEFRGILDVLFHGWVLYYLFLGAINGRKLKTLPEETAEAEAPENAVPAVNTDPIRRADFEIKHRVFLEAESAGCRICFRRVKYPVDGHWQTHRNGLRWTANYKNSKMVNELVINGYVYGELEMMMEPSHMLSAVVNGHLIQAGYESAGSYSYICVDGVQVAKKMRWF